MFKEQLDHFDIDFLSDDELVALIEARIGLRREELTRDFSPSQDGAQKTARYLIDAFDR